jgi:hypothetical protein
MILHGTHPGDIVSVGIEAVDSFLLQFSSLLAQLITLQGLHCLLKKPEDIKIAHRGRDGWGLKTVLSGSCSSKRRSRHLRVLSFSLISNLFSLNLFALLFRFYRR